MSRPARDALTSTEAGALLGVSAATVKRWSDEGALPTVRTRGGHRRFRRADVEEVATRLRSDGTSPGTLAERLAARESVLLVQADLLAERARSGSWKGVVDACVSALNALANSQRLRGAPYVSTRIAHAILQSALGRCADELPTAPGAPTVVVAATDGEPFVVALALARLAARAAGWKAWSVESVTAAELAHFAAARATDAVVLFASIARSRIGLAEMLEAAEAACGAAGIPLAVAGGAPWPAPRAGSHALRSLAEIGDWLDTIVPAR